MSSFSSLNDVKATLRMVEGIREVADFLEQSAREREGILSSSGDARRNDPLVTRREPLCCVSSFV